MAAEPRTIGRYEVVDRIGRGGMGVVFKAKDPRIGRQVAIKLLSVHDEALRDRFVQEAQSVGNLAHRNIVTIFDFGEHEGQAYIVMEYVEGVTLADQIHDNVPIPLWRKLEIIEELSGGLDYAHNKGIVHRDVKPANVMTDRDGVVKILDFGIARVGNITMTQAGMMLGTPNYMSPEQFESGRVDRRSDIFSVGVLFYELLAYRKAFTGDQVWDVMKAVMSKSPRPLSEFIPGIDPAVEAAVSRAIEKDPAHRYQSLAEMIADLARARARIGVRLATQESDTVMTPPGVPAPWTPRPTDREAIARRRAERIDAYLADARRAFDAGEFGTAVEACDQALLLDPDDARVHTLIARARHALDHQQAVEILAEARASLERGDLDQAASLVGQAVQLDTSFQEARDAKAAISDRIRQRDAERKKRQQELAAAQKMVERQKREFAAGHYHEAIGALEHFSPRLEIVVAAIADMRSELAEIDRRAREEEEQQRREQEEAQRRWVARQFDLAKRAMAVQKFVEAIEILEHVRRNISSAPGLDDLLKQAHHGKSAADEAVRRQQEIAGILERAAAEAAQGKLLDARSLVASALSMDPAHPEALASLREIKSAIEAEERQKQEAARQREAERQRREREEAAAVAARAKKEEEAAAALAKAKRRRDAAAAEARAKREREAAAAAAEARAKAEREAAALAEARAREEREAAAAAEARAARDREAAAAEARAKQEREAAAAAEAVARQEREAAAAEARARQEREAAAAAAEARARKERDAAAAEARAKQEREAAEARRKAEAAQRPSATAPDIDAIPAEPSPAPVEASGGLARLSLASYESARALAQRAAAFLPPLSELTQPTPRSLGIGGAALFLLLILYFAFRGPSTPGTQVARAPEPAPAPTTTVAPPTTTVAPAPTTVPPADAAAPAVTPVASPPPPAPPTVDEQLAQLRDQARQQFRAGEWQKGLATAASAFELRQGDPGTQTILNSALTTVRTRMTAERDATTAIGRYAVESNAFKTAIRKQESVDQLRRNGQTPEAIRSAWETIDLFKLAQAEGRRLAQLEAATPRPGAPAPTPALPPPTTQPTPQGSVQPPAAPPAATPAPAAAPAPPQPAPPRPGTQTPAPPPTPVSNPEADKRDINNVLLAFAAAYSQLNPRAVQRVYPGIDVQALTSSFSKLRSQQVAISNVQFVNLTDSTATVTCTWSVAFVGSAGGTNRQSLKLTIRLQKNSGVWSIVDRR